MAMPLKLLSTFLAGKTTSSSSSVVTSLPSSSSSSSSSFPFRLAHAPSPPANLRMLRTVTSATVSEPATGKPLRGIMRPRRVSPEMQDLVGVPEISRTQALKQIWAYIKENNLQDPENKKFIICDEKLKKIFGGKNRIGFLEIAGLISPHFLK